MSPLDGSLRSESGIARGWLVGKGSGSPKVAQPLGFATSMTPPSLASSGQQGQLGAHGKGINGSSHQSLGPALSIRSHISRQHPRFQSFARWCRCRDYCVAVARQKTQIAVLLRPGFRTAVPTGTYLPRYCGLCILHSAYRSVDSNGIQKSGQRAKKNSILAANVLGDISPILADFSGLRLRSEAKTWLKSHAAFRCRQPASPVAPPHPGRSSDSPTDTAPQGPRSSL